MALSFAAGWLVLARTVTAHTATALLAIGVAGALAAGAALVAARMLRRRPWSARFAAAFLVLTVGTCGLASFFIAARIAWLSHPLPDLPLHIVLVILAITGIGALYGFLAIAGFLILPLGLPLIVLFATILARTPR